MARKVLTRRGLCGNIPLLSARLAQLVEHMLDVHGVTGSSPVPRTMVKSPETITVSGLFVILTNGAVGILWKMREKVAETDFSGFLAAAKKTGGLPDCEWQGGRLPFSVYARRARSLSYSSPLTLLNSSSSWGTVSLAFSSPEMSSTTRPLCSMMSRLP